MTPLSSKVFINQRINSATTPPAVSLRFAAAPRWAQKVAADACSWLQRMAQAWLAKRKLNLLMLSM
jgi:hypothetical protein